MHKNILIGIDIGTTTCKAVFLDADTGCTVATELEEVTSISENPGWVAYDADMWWDATKRIVSRGIRKSGIDPGSIAGLSFGGFTVMAFMVDENGDPLNKPTHYSDMRHLPEMEYLQNKIGKRAVEINNNAMGVYNGLAKQLWFKNNMPELYKKTKYFTTEAGWLTFKLTGKWSFNRCEAGFYAQYDYKTRQWSKEILDAAGIPPEKYPPLFDAWEKVGEVTDKAAGEIGLAAGTPVFAGADDASPVAISTGAIKAGQCYVSIGSGSNIVTNLATPIYHSTCIFYPHCIPDLHMFVSVQTSTGLSYKWVRDTIASTEVSMAALLDVDPYTLMEKEIELTKPGANGLVFLPYLEGEYTPIDDVNARGVFVGISSATTRGDIMRAVMEGNAMAILHNIVTIEQLGGNLDELIVTGGPTKSKAWMQIISDVTGRPISLPEETEGAPFGDAIIAGVGAGVFKDFDEAVAKMVRIRKNAFTPNKENADLYNSMFKVYRKTYLGLKEVFTDLSEIRNKM